MTVLIVEDDYNDYKLATTFLKFARLDFIWTEKGENAIEIVQKNFDIGLVLTDIKLPGINGYETAQKIKVIRKDLPIIALSAYSGNQEKEIALQKGCDDYLSKPYKGKDFFAILKRWIKFDAEFPEGSL